MFSFLSFNSRLTRLEQRVEQLEVENRQLKEDLNFTVLKPVDNDIIRYWGHDPYFNWPSASIKVKDVVETILKKLDIELKYNAPRSYQAPKVTVLDKTNSI